MFAEKVFHIFFLGPFDASTVTTLWNQRPCLSHIPFKPALGSVRVCRVAAKSFPIHHQECVAVSESDRNQLGTAACFHLTLHSLFDVSLTVLMTTEFVHLREFFHTHKLSVKGWDADDVITVCGYLNIKLTDSCVCVPLNTSNMYMS